MMVIDGNGESQVVALFNMRSKIAALLQLLTKFRTNLRRHMSMYLNTSNKMCSVCETVRAS